MASDMALPHGHIVSRVALCAGISEALYTFMAYSGRSQFLSFVVADGVIVCCSRCWPFLFFGHFISSLNTHNNAKARFCFAAGCRACPSHGAIVYCSRHVAAGHFNEHVHVNIDTSSLASFQ